ncbi:ESCRT-II complex subunit-domain-containing protein [Blastocladiella britannica]|nr:ESCRT-II complex subunit-domain-containing protein [Blastocladiella britannica]
MAQFTFPLISTFPPFYTLQPHPESQAKQLAAWVDLVRDYCAHHRLYRLDLSTAHTLDLFSNAAISRAVTRDMLASIFAECVKCNLAEWASPKDHSRILVLWKAVPQWASVILEWAKKFGFTGTVLTGYEVRFGDYAADAEFYDMDEALFLRVIKHLVKQGNATLVNPSDIADELGFKLNA